MFFIKKRHYIWMGFSLVISFLIIQISSSSTFCWLGFKKIAVNLLLELIIWFVFFFISWCRVKVACVGTVIFNTILGFANAQVLIFRGNEISINDIRSINTALSVADQYKIEINFKLGMVLAIGIIAVVILLKSKLSLGISKKEVIISGISMGAGILVVLLAATKYTPFTMRDEGALYNGYLLEQVIEMTSAGRIEPENYSEEQVNEIVSKYEALQDETEETDHPNIIIIMSESYSDPEVLGNIVTNEDYNSYFKKVSTSTLHGYALSSVYGGTTANSEWEFLTASSTFFMPEGTIPYQQYINDRANSLVKAMNAQDYKTISVHPYKPEGWRRDAVYPKFGFDESIWEEDFEEPEYVREYISDRSFYSKIIQLFEEKENEKLFVFGISMQNHGGYGSEMQPQIEIDNMQGEYSDANQYLSLLKISDEALRDLIEYFTDYDEKVIILFFGDHQPRLNEQFYAELGTDEQSKYIIPWFVWDNAGELKSEEEPLTSINYLSSIMLEAEHLPMTKYNRALIEIRNQIPAINAWGYWDSDGNWNNEAKQEDEEIRDLQLLQYVNNIDANMLDKNEAFFMLGAGK